MDHRRTSWWAWAAALLAVAAGRGAAQAGEDPAKPWRDPKILEARLAEACDAVEKATGIPFKARPTVRISTTKEVSAILRLELAPSMKAMGQESSAGSVVDLLADGIMAKYETATNIVHVVPGAVEKMAEILKEPLLENEDTLRVILAHETTHAHDFPIYGWDAMRDTRSTQESQQALNAIVEGHAQLVAEEVAARWGLSPAFERFTRSITALPPVDDPTMKRIAQSLVAQVGFAYVQGHSFLKAVKAARGGDGVEQALQSPPEGTRVVEHPETWLDPKAAAKGVDLATVLEAMRPLVGDPAWKVRTDRILEAALETQRASVPEAFRAAYLKGYEDGRVLAADVAGEEAKVILLVLRFKTEDDAKAHIALERATAASQDESMKTGAVKILSSEYVEGAGPENRFPGFRARKTLSAYGSDATVETALAIVGRSMVQVMVTNAASLDRAAQDEALARGAAVLTDPEAAKVLPPLVPRKFQGKFFSVVIRVLDGDGKPVPKAQAMYVWQKSEHESVSQNSEVEDGKARFVHLEASGTIEVWGAASVDGTPLAWGPSTKEGVGRDSGEVEFRLPPGVTIDGRVRTADGKGAAGLTVNATPKSGHWRPSAHPHATSTTDADGAFHLMGVGMGAYRIDVEASKGFAAPAPVEAKGGDVGIEIVAGGASDITLTILAWDEAPVEGASVTATLKEPLGPNSWTDREIAVGVTDAKGVATLHGLSSIVPYRLKIRAAAPREDLVPIDREGWKAEASTMRLEHGYVIKGVVKDAKGAPVAADVWRKTGGGSSVIRQAGTDGTFRLEGVPYGPAQIGAVPLSQPGIPSGQPSRWVTVTPEKPEVVLGMGLIAGPAAGPRLTVENGRREQEVFLFPEGDAAPDRGRPGVLDAKLSVPLERYDASLSYTLWIPTWPGGDLLLLQKGFQITGQDVRVTLVPALTIEGHLRGIDGATGVEVSVRGPGDAIFPAQSITTEGDFAIRGLPSGTWKVKAKARGESAYLYASADVEAGTSVTLTLKPK